MVADPAEPARVIEVARGWLATPYVRGAALRGVGCDCVGLARGVWAEVTGANAPPPAPAWAADWAVSWPRALFPLARSILIEIEAPAARAGDLVAIRTLSGRVAHLGILAPAGRLIHATEVRGVVETPLSGWSDRLAAAFRFPAAP